ncbi:MAG: TetR/AcrR family transcriptional regulator [Bacillota bacterium]
MAGEKRMEILQAAIKIFSKEGFHKAKIDDIAMAAGIGKGTVYQYFSSKQELFQEMIKFMMKRYDESIDLIISKDQGFKDKLLMIAENHVKFVSQHIDMAQMIMNQSDLISKEMKCWIMEQKEAAYKSFERLVEDGINRGEVRQDIDREIAASSIIGTMNQYYGRKIFRSKEKNRYVDPLPLVDFLSKTLCV